LKHELAKPVEIFEAITRSIESGSQKLANIMARGDGYQATAEENVTVHHYANVLFNILRGGSLMTTIRFQPVTSQRPFETSTGMYTSEIRTCLRVYQKN